MRNYEKKHRNANGDTCWVFAWEQGGGNHVYSHSKRGAQRRATLFGAGTHTRDGDKLKHPAKGDALTPDPSTIRSVSLTELREFDQGLRMMYFD